MSQHALQGNQPSVVLPAYLTKGAFQEQSLQYLQLNDGGM